MCTSFSSFHVFKPGKIPYYFWSLKGRDIFVTINISCNSCYNQVRRNGSYNRRTVTSNISRYVTKLVVTAYFLESNLKVTDKLKFTAWFVLNLTLITPTFKHI